MKELIGLAYQSPIAVCLCYFGRCFYLCFHNLYYRCCFGHFQGNNCRKIVILKLFEAIHFRKRFLKDLISKDGFLWGVLGSCIGRSLCLIMFYFLIFLRSLINGKCVEKSRVFILCFGILFSMKIFFVFNRNLLLSSVFLRIRNPKGRIFLVLLSYLT